MYRFLRRVSGSGSSEISRSTGVVPVSRSTKLLGENNPEPDHASDQARPLAWLKRHAREIPPAKVTSLYFERAPKGVYLIGYFSTPERPVARELENATGLNEFKTQARMRNATPRYFSSKELPSFIAKT